MVGVGVTHSWDSQNKCLPKAMLCPAIAQGWSRGSRGMEALTPRSPRLCGRQTPKYRLTAGTEGSWEPGHRGTQALSIGVAHRGRRRSGWPLNRAAQGSSGLGTCRSHQRVRRKHLGWGWCQGVGGGARVAGTAVRRATGMERHRLGLIFRACGPSWAGSVSVSFGPGDLTVPTVQMGKSRGREELGLIAGQWWG